MQIWDAFAVRTSLWLRVSSFLHRHFMRIYVIAKVKKLLDCIFLPAEFVDLSWGLPKIFMFLLTGIYMHFICSDFFMVEIIDYDGLAFF